MSHNKITVANQNPDSAGNISVDITNLSDVNVSSPSSNQVIKYDGSEWINSAAPAGTGEYIQIGRGETYSSNYPFLVPGTANRVIYIYDTNPVNTISGATLNQSSTTNWYTSVTLPAGKYMFISQTNVNFSSSGYLVYQLKNNSNASRSPAAKIGDNASGYAGGVVSTINSFLNLTSSETISIKVFAASGVSGTASDHDGYIDEFTYLIIVKV